MKTMAELKVSSRFDLEDIRKIRDYDAARYRDMTREEILEDIRESAARMKQRLKNYKEETYET